MTKRLPLAFAILTGCATLAPAQDFNLKPGLWEFTLTSQIKGDPASMLSAAESAGTQMSPEMKAGAEAMIRKLSTAPANPIIYKKCVTKIELQKLLDKLSAGESNANCKFTPVRSTATLLEGREGCSSSKMSSNAIVRFEAPNPEALTGRIERTMSAGSGGFDTVSNITGKWLGPSCGDVKP
jgi:hypothetical protein